ncbi:YbaB/EbfC family nucleoid-associated protein [Corynebacterium mendelii]|uniref:Nucleoid-associated protein JZY06_03720 n=1 Tax=Corynebacterium mendelii TaxID=2765362 RepID=A0A939IX60_9CORY|nr:YbaB/EbfC family nucleoid-associated protein [Corynebacterium mendelii]MBN9643733.1 YbaB/EbfC family nucleoid-associated protein [Corynebacterium mendelii]
MTQPDMSQLIQQAQAMQAKLQEAQQQIVNSSVVGQVLDGKVQVTMHGTGKVSDIKIDPSVVDADDVETLQDLIVGAFEDAHTKISKLAEDTMGPLNQAMGQGGIGEMLGGMN